MHSLLHKECVYLTKSSEQIVTGKLKQFPSIGEWRHERVMPLTLFVKKAHENQLLTTPSPHIITCVSYNACTVLNVFIRIVRINQLQKHQWKLCCHSWTFVTELGSREVNGVGVVWILTVSLLEIWSPNERLYDSMSWCIGSMEFCIGSLHQVGENWILHVRITHRDTSKRYWMISTWWNKTISSQNLSHITFDPWNISLWVNSPTESTGMMYWLAGHGSVASALYLVWLRSPLNVPSSSTFQTVGEFNIRLPIRLFYVASDYIYWDQWPVVL